MPFHHFSEIVLVLSAKFFGRKAIRLQMSELPALDVSIVSAQRYIAVTINFIFGKADRSAR